MRYHCKIIESDQLEKILRCLSRYRKSDRS